MLAIKKKRGELERSGRRWRWIKPIEWDSNFIYFRLLLLSIFVVGNDVDDDGPFWRMLHLTSMGIKSQWLTFFLPKLDRVYNEKVIGGQDVTQSLHNIHSVRGHDSIDKKERRAHYTVIMKWRRKISQLNWRALKNERANVCALMAFHVVPVKSSRSSTSASIVGISIKELHRAPNDGA